MENRELYMRGLGGRKLKEIYCNYNINYSSSDCPKQSSLNYRIESSSSTDVSFPSPFSFIHSFIHVSVWVSIHVWADAHVVEDRGKAWMLLFLRCHSFFVFEKGSFTGLELHKQGSTWVCLIGCWDYKCFNMPGFLFVFIFNMGPRIFDLQPIRQSFYQLSICKYFQNPTSDLYCWPTEKCFSKMLGRYINISIE